MSFVLIIASPEDCHSEIIKHPERGKSRWQCVRAALEPTPWSRRASVLYRNTRSIQLMKAEHTHKGQTSSSPRPGHHSAMLCLASLDDICSHVRRAI